MKKIENLGVGAYLARTIIVTRHAALAAYLIEIGAVPADATIIPHATADDIRGRHVAGPLPLHLAALAESIIHIPLDIPVELRGVELSLPQVRALAKPVERYMVIRVPQEGTDGLPCCVVCGRDGW